MSVNPRHRSPSERQTRGEGDPLEPGADEDARTRILDAAHRLVGEGGFEGTSIRDIARESATNPALAYYYFGSKQGIFEALAHRNADRASEALGEAVQLQGTTRERVRHFLRAWMKALYEPARPLAPWFRKAIQDRSVLGDLLRLRVANNLSLLAGILDEGVARGEIRAPSLPTLTVATGLMMSVAGLAMEVLLPHDLSGVSLKSPAEKDAFIDGMLDAWFGGLETRPSS